MAEEEARAEAERQAAAAAVGEEEARQYHSGGGALRGPQVGGRRRRGLPVVEDADASAGGTPVNGTREQEAAQEVTEGETRTGALRRVAAVSAEEARRQVADALAKAVAAAAEDADAASGGDTAASSFARKRLL